MIGLMLAAGLVATLAAPGQEPVPPEIADLIEKLESEDELVRSKSASRLGNLGEKANAAAPALIRCLKDTSQRVRSDARTSLGCLSPKIGPLLLEALKDDHPESLKDLLGILRGLKVEPGDAAERVVRLLRHADFDVRHAAQYYLGTLTKGGERAVPALLQCLKDEDWEVQREAGSILGNLGAQAKAAVPSLIDRLRTDDERFWVMSSRALMKAGVDSIPLLCKALQDPDPRVQLGIAMALTEMQPIQKDAVIPVLVHLKVARLDIRLVALQGLLTQKALPQEAQPHLLPLLKDKDVETRIKATMLLGITPPTAAVAPGIVERLSDPNMVVASEALRVLPKLGKLAKGAGPALAKLLEEAPAVFRQDILSAIEAVGPEAKEAVPALLSALPVSRPETQQRIVRALGAIGPEAKEAVPALEALINDRIVGNDARAAVTRIKSAR